uniref:Dynein light chain n=1 Tax=Lates calcarifer TaxID=8187 RepID=A0A4W6C6A2_LATCA
MAQILCVSYYIIITSSLTSLFSSFTETLCALYTALFKSIDDNDCWDAWGLESLPLCVCVSQCVCEDDKSSAVFWFPRATMSDRKAVIKNADMSEDMQQDAVECATQALEKYNIEKDIAAYIKKEFDKKYNPTWHCIVGRNFGSYVTHETKHFIYFYLGQVAILLFKSG